MERIWKVGDWCFFDFHVSHVTRADHPSYSCANGSTECSGRIADRMFQLDPKILQISESFRWTSESLGRDLEKYRLNWPDIHRWIVDKWAAACESKDNEVALKKHMNELSDFSRKLRDECKDISLKEVAGVRAFVRQ